MGLLDLPLAKETKGEGEGWGGREGQGVGWGGGERKQWGREGEGRGGERRGRCGSTMELVAAVSPDRRRRWEGEKGRRKREQWGRKRAGMKGREGRKGIHCCPGPELVVATGPGQHRR
ncbi:hypothetical protein AAC387_Pa06g0091 [Persea americana]